MSLAEILATTKNQFCTLLPMSNNDDLATINIQYRKNNKIPLFGVYDHDCNTCVFHIRGSVFGTLYNQGLTNFGFLSFCNVVIKFHEIREIHYVSHR